MCVFSGHVTFTVVLFLVLLPAVERNEMHSSVPIIYKGSKMWKTMQFLWEASSCQKHKGSSILS